MDLMVKQRADGAEMGCKKHMFSKCVKAFLKCVRIPSILSILSILRTHGAVPSGNPYPSVRYSTVFSPKMVWTSSMFSTS